MKKSIRFLGMTLAILLLLTFVPFTAFASAPNEITTAPDAFRYIKSGSTVTIRRGTLYQNNASVGEIYLIGLECANGSLNPNDIRGTLSCMRSCFSLNNRYVKEALRQIEAQVPSGARVALVGHSLGGMVAQQLAANKTMKSRYEIVATLAIGSPYIVTGPSKEGMIHRLADRADIVPGLSIAGFANIWAGNVSYESSGFVADKAHHRSYADAACWLKYDCFGIRNGGYRIVLDP